MGELLVVVADRAEARFYEHAGPGGRLRDVETIRNAAAHLHEQALVSSRAGRFDRAVGGQSLGPHHRARAIADARFARQVARRIGGRLATEGHSALVLAASARVLGLLRAELSPAATRLLVATHPRDLIHHGQAQLRSRLDETLERARRAIAGRALARRVRH